MNNTLSLHVNGKDYEIDIDPDTPLLYVLRNELGLNGAKFGCGLQQCGACTVLLDGESRLSCQLPVREAVKFKIRTIEGLVRDDGSLHPVQAAFVKEQAAQCGYCLNGMVMASVALLEGNNNPSDDEIRKKLAINICRCGAHSRIIKAVKTAAQEL
ncbi:(2Fe-2S)-binding protein [Pseudozobellia thermophila]|uniref:Nicotinate dehydrogenase subunit A n=1 Tax=Pseudozobellia thermophila TaxID=192903 RepID=A0A1M6CV98_9FLAO|nr:(2Fe-2S)-binding protein [Pseudozobellia thermophila]SHI64906.1 nicotinate dehydrogenase subunit A [Pseudozobellia thermophila]